MNALIRINKHWLDLEQVTTWRKTNLIKRIWLKIFRSSHYKKFPLNVRVSQLINAIKEAMKEFSNPTFTIAKGLDATPKEIDALKKKVIAEEMAKPDYLQLKQTLVLLHETN